MPTRSINAARRLFRRDYRTLDAPEANHYERAYEHDVIPEADGSVPVGIVNRARGIGAYEVFNLQQLPIHFVWRMLGEGSYVIGIEPCTIRRRGAWMRGSGAS